MNSNSRIPIFPMIFYDHCPASLIPSSHQFWSEVCGVLPLVWICFPLCTSPQLTAGIFHPLPPRCLIKTKLMGEIERWKPSNRRWRYKPKEERFPLAMIRNKGGRADLGRKALKTILPRPRKNDAPFSPEVQGATVYPAIFTTAPQPCAQKGGQQHSFQKW